jgi:hypothetical protein
LLKEQISVRGGAAKGAAVTVGDKTVSDIAFHPTSVVHRANVSCKQSDMV